MRAGEHRAGRASGHPAREPHRWLVTSTVATCAAATTGMSLVLGCFYVSLLRWLAPGRSDWPRVGLSPRLPAGHDNDVRRHRGLPDRYGVRRPRRACLLAGHLNVEQPPSARGHRCELAFTGVIICACWSLEVFGTTGLGADQLAMLPPFLVIAWGVDEFVRVTWRRCQAGAELVG